MGKPGPAGIGGAFIFYFSCTADFIDSSEAELLAILKAQASDPGRPFMSFNIFIVKGNNFYTLTDTEGLTMP